MNLWGENAFSRTSKYKFYWESQKLSYQDMQTLENPTFYKNKKHTKPFPIHPPKTECTFSPQLPTTISWFIKYICFQTCF